jgi:hypothetical protein
MKLCNKNRQNAHFLHQDFIVSSTCFEHPSVYSQEDFYIKFFMVFLSCILTNSLVDGRMCLIQDYHDNINNFLDYKFMLKVKILHTRLKNKSNIS